MNIVKEWNNLVFEVSEDGITVYDKKTPEQKEKHFVTPERRRELLKAVFDVFIKKGVRNDEVYYLLTYIIENPVLILMPVARDRELEGKGATKGKNNIGDEKE